MVLRIVHQGGEIMKKVSVLLLMVISLFAFSCGGGGEQDILEGDVPGNDITDLRDDKDEQENVRNILIFHPDETVVGTGVNPDGTLVGSDVTDLKEYRKDIPLFGKFMEVLSTANPDGTLVGSDVNSGWVTYRWKDGSETDCDGDYKVSYLERVSDNRFVGGGMCLLDTGKGNWWRLYQLNGTGNRFVNLWKLVNTAMVDLSGLWSYSTENINIMCQRYHTNKIGNLGPPPTLENMSNENRELYLFVGELTGSSTDGSVSVDVKCHPDSTLIGSTYRFTDNSRREFSEEVVDELNSLGSRSERDEGIWNAYTFPKLGQHDTSSDPPKLSYFRVAHIHGRKYVAGAGIYLDVNNPNVDPDNPTRLEEIRNRVSEAADLLRGKEGEELIEALEDNRDYFTNDEDPEAYIFVWENRPE